MKILHVITGMQKAAGTSVFCGEVANGLVALGHDVDIAVANPESADSYPVDSRVELISVVSLLHSPTPSLPHFDLVHIHALWSPVLHRVARWARSQKIPIVWSPHGMLTPWAMHNKWLKKQLGWWLYQRWDLCRADLLHVTAESEVEDVRRMGLKNKVVLAPLGVNVDGRVERVGRVDGMRTLLFVSRVQRKKGLENLVRAWAQLKSEISTRSARSARLNNWRIRIVGPDQENHTAELKALCCSLGVDGDFDFVGPKYGDELQHEYANADLFALPTYSENFGSVVIEALAHGVPVITTKGTPWHELEGYADARLTTCDPQLKCGWWIDIGVEPLAKALDAAISLSDAERREMGERGRKLVEEKYTWDVVVKTLVKEYEEVRKKEEGRRKKEEVSKKEEGTDSAYSATSTLAPALLNSTTPPLALLGLIWSVGNMIYYWYAKKI